MIGSYSPYQVELSNRVIYLRDSKGLTFKGIADLLMSEGYRSPRGFDLGSESVFSIYKKRKIRDKRLSTEPSVELKTLKVNEDEN